MHDMRDLLLTTAERAADYLAGLDRRPVVPQKPAAELRARLLAQLPDGPTDPKRVIEAFVREIEPGLVSVAGGRYFGFVTGGSVPAALAADWLAAAWDQNSFAYVSSPAASIVEDITARWIKDLLELPAPASVAFVTGCQMAHVTSLAAARHEMLRRVGWDLPRRGLAGAPRVRIITGERRHVTLDRAVRLLGLGSDAIELVDTDDQGRTRADAMAKTLAAGAGPTIVVAQAGEVNTGSFDPLAEIIEAAHRQEAWVHVDGAFGIWARASARLRHHTNALERADSWAFDAHKWLNVPYDSGIAVVADPEPHRSAMLGEAAYLTPTSTERDAYDWTPEASRRARGFAVYAALRSLGRRGVGELVDRCCAHARRFAAGLAEMPGAEVLNDVVLNQVLVRFGDDTATKQILERVQRSGEAWVGSTNWDDQAAIRVSVSSWATSEEDVERTLATFRNAAG